MLLPLLVLLVAATPSPQAGPAAPGAAAPLKLAAPGLTGLNLAPEATTFYSDHLAQALSLQGVRVMTASEMGAVLGLERQRRLLGCDEANAACRVELSDALGVDGLVTGSIGRFDTLYQVNVKVIRARDGTPLAQYAGRATGEKALLEELERAAKAMAPQLRHGRLAQAPAAAAGAGQPSPAEAVAAPAPEAPSAKVALGEKCKADGQCASGQCLYEKGSRCAKAGECHKEGGGCNDASDCCAGVACDLTVRKCKVPWVTGFQNDFACRAHDECRTGWCQDGKCQDMPRTCRGVGSYCKNNPCCEGLMCYRDYPMHCCLPPDSPCSVNDKERGLWGGTFCCSGECVDGVCQ